MPFAPVPTISQSRPTYLIRVYRRRESAGKQRESMGGYETHTRPCGGLTRIALETRTIGFTWRCPPRRPPRDWRRASRRPELPLPHPAAAFATAALVFADVIADAVFVAASASDAAVPSPAKLVTDATTVVDAVVAAAALRNAT